MVSSYQPNISLSISIEDKFTGFVICLSTFVFLVTVFVKLRIESSITPADPSVVSCKHSYNEKVNPSAESIFNRVLIVDANTNWPVVF